MDEILLISYSRCYYCTKIKFFMKDFFSKCNQIRSFLRNWSHLQQKSLMQNFIFCATYLMKLGTEKPLRYLMHDN